MKSETKMAIFQAYFNLANLRRIRWKLVL